MRILFFDVHGIDIVVNTLNCISVISTNSASGRPIWNILCPWFPSYKAFRLISRRLGEKVGGDWLSADDLSYKIWFCPEPPNGSSAKKQIRVNKLVVYGQLKWFLGLYGLVLQTGQKSGIGLIWVDHVLPPWHKLCRGRYFSLELKRTATATGGGGP